MKSLEKKGLVELPEIASLLYSHLISNAHNFCVHFYYPSHAPSELSPLCRRPKTKSLEGSCKIKKSTKSMGSLEQFLAHWSKRNGGM